MDDPDVKLLVLIVLAAAVLAGFWYFREDILPRVEEPVVTQSAPAVPARPVENEPIHPLAPLPSSDPFDGALVPLPPLDDSDSYFVLALVDLFGSNVESLLVAEALIDRFVATTDNLPRSHVAEKIRPVGRLADSFVVTGQGENGKLMLSADNYHRYDVLVELIDRADLDAVAETYRRFYPLLQESYVRLGYPNGYFNDRVVEVIDHLLATPQPAEPIPLVRPHVLYEYADPDLEARSSGQKLLLRMGSGHAATIKRALLELRALITASED